jgi:hypothetical protein
MGISILFLYNDMEINEGWRVVQRSTLNNVPDAINAQFGKYQVEAVFRFISLLSDSASLTYELYTMRKTFFLLKLF